MDKLVICTHAYKCGVEAENCAHGSGHPVKDTDKGEWGGRIPCTERSKCNVLKKVVRCVEVKQGILI